MELIKIIFFSFGSLFGVENSSIIAEKTTVKIDTQKHTISISLENLLTMVSEKQDSIKASNELYRIGNPESKAQRYNWSPEFKSYPSKTFDITRDKTKKQLNATITLTYNSDKDLKDFSIDYVAEDKSYALINIDS